LSKLLPVFNVMYSICLISQCIVERLYWQEKNVSRLIKLVGGRENVLFNHETPLLGYQHKYKNKISDV
jgi:hypothetical protein